MHQVLIQAYESFATELEGVDTALSQLHPAGKPHLWTIQQVTEHLILSVRETRKQLEERIEKKRLSTRTRRTRVEWLLQLMVLSFGHMPSGIPAAEETEPGAELLPATGRDLARVLRIELEALDCLMDKCRQQFGIERVGRHFLLGPVRVDQWRRYHVVHLRHHQEQLRRIRAELLEPVAQTHAVAARA